MDRVKSEAILRRLAALIEEAPGPPAVARLLERVSTQDNPEALRDALVERGAEAVLDDVRRVRCSVR